jgi:zinc protease
VSSRVDHRQVRDPAGTVAAAAAAALLVGWTSCATVAIPDVARTLPSRQYALASGLRVVIEDDPTASIVGAVWVVEAGAIDDPADRYGLAHAVEHLVLATPDARGVTAWQRLIDLGGIGVNARTQLEQTEFQVFAPRSQLDALARAVVGQMAHPLGGADDRVLAGTLENQRMILAEEGDLRTDATISDERFLLARLFAAGDPYGVVARRPEGAAPGLSVADARGFVQARYQPQRMTLVLSGSIPAEWDARLWAMMPPALRGDASALRAPERRAPSPSPPPRDVDLTLERQASTVARPELRIGWWLPGARGLDEVPLRVLSAVVGRALLRGQEEGTLKNVIRASVRIVVHDRASLLTVSLVLRDVQAVDVSREGALELVTRRAFSSALTFVASGRVALKEAELRAALALEALPARTMTRALLAHDEWGAGIDSFLEAIKRVTAEQLSAVAGQNLTRAASRSVLLLPAPAAIDGAPVASQSSHEDGPSPGIDPGPPPSAPEAEPEASAAAGAATAANPGDGAARSVHSPAEVQAVAAAPTASAAQVTRLANGLTVIVLRRPGLPFVSVLQGFHSVKSTDAPAGIRLASRFGRRYGGMAGPLTRQVLWQGVETRDDVHEEEETYAPLVDRAIELLGEEARALEIKFPDKAFLRWVADGARREASAEFVAERRFAGALWGDHPYGVSPPAALVGERSQAEVRAWIDRVERPDNGALVVVGDIDPAHVVASVTANLRDAWQHRAAHVAPLVAPPPPEPRTPGADAPTVVFTQSPQRKTAAIRFGCLLPPVHGARDQALSALFIELFRQALFDRLRGDQGQSYAPQVGWVQLWGGSAVLSGQLDVPAAAAGAGVEGLRGFLQPGAAPWFDGTAIEHARWRAALTNAARFSTNMQMARALFVAWQMGLPPASLDELPAHLASVGAADLAAALRACQASSVISVLGPLAP